MKFKLSGTLLLLLLCNFFSSAQQRQDAIQITAITTSNSVKIELYNNDADPKQKYRATIKDVRNNEIIFNQPIEVIETTDSKAKIFFIKGLKPKLWYPGDPNLYILELIKEKDGMHTLGQKKIGFRDFNAIDGKFYLNGKPVFLRGNAINPPGRGINDSLNNSKKFAEDYIDFLKSININIVRFPRPAKNFWYEVCDEKGMMVFGGNYSGSVNGETPPKDYDKALSWFKENRFASIAHHPSLVVYVINNETAFTGVRGAEWLKFHTYIHQNLLKWDNTRPYIANAGYGYGKAGDICDLHRYWGWYYNTPFTFINIRDQKEIIPFQKPASQPITFTECVGNYIGPDGRYNLTPDNKAPQSQLNWTGHASKDMQILLANEHQAFTYKMSTELFRRMRYLNPDLSGVVPFTILFDNWNTIKGFSDMYPKPVTQQAKKSFQPVLVSWENWQPNLYAGAEFQPIVHIVNDDDYFGDLQNASLQYSIIDEANNELFQNKINVPLVKYYETFREKLTIKIPETITEGWYYLTGKIIKDDKVISQNEDMIYIAAKPGSTPLPNKSKNILLYDNEGKTSGALKAMGIHFKPIKGFKNIKPTDVIIIGENSADKIVAESSGILKKFINAGGRLLLLKQGSENWPQVKAITPVEIVNIRADVDKATYPRPAGPSTNGINVNPERPDHLVFSGIERRNLRQWSDYTGWNETKKDFPAIYPVTNGFILKNKTDIGSAAVLANYGPGLNAMALAEFFDGRGSVLVSGFDLARRSGIDPIADRLLKNLIHYMAAGEHEQYPLITSPIKWGEYETEKGLLTGEVSGLLLNPHPRLLGGDKLKYKLVITEDGHQFAANNRVLWADLPGQQYIPYGRRPFGPYYLRGMGSIAEIEKNANKKEGTGFFYCRVAEGVTKSLHTIWNPANEELYIKISANENEVKKAIPPKSVIIVECPVKDSNIKMQLTGDRRLVLLQTSFE